MKQIISLVMIILMMIPASNINAQSLGTRQTSKQARVARRIARQDAVLAKNLNVNKASEFLEQERKIQRHMDFLKRELAKATSDSAQLFLIEALASDSVRFKVLKSLDQTTDFQKNQADAWWTEAGKLEAARNKIIYDYVTDKHLRLTDKEKRSYFNGFDVLERENTQKKSEAVITLLYSSPETPSSVNIIKPDSAASNRKPRIDTVQKSYTDFEGIILNERGASVDIYFIPVNGSGGEKTSTVVKKYSQTKFRLTPGTYRIEAFADGYKVNSENCKTMHVPSPTGTIIDSQMFAWWYKVPRF